MMRPVLALTTAALMVLPLAACGKGENGSGGGLANPAAPAAPTLSKDQLESAMVDTGDLSGSGWSRDKKEEADTSASSSSSSSTSSDQGPCGLGDEGGAEEVYSSNRVFAKGSGFSMEQIQVEVNQYKNEDEAKKSFSDGAKKLDECKEWTNPENGEKATISDMSVEKVGDENDAKKMVMKTSGMEVTVEMRYSRVGSTIMTVMDLGLMSTPSTEATAAEKKQAEKLKSALAAAK